MKERVWVKINGLQLHHLVPAKNGSRPEKTVWASLKLGSELNINGVLINSRAGKKDWFSQGWGNADTRLIDVPALHNAGEKYTLLMEALAKAVHDFCLRRAEVLRPFIENGATGDELTLGFFKPEAWQGKSLMIPVDFIRLQNFQPAGKGKTGIVAADIQIGHHLIFWGVAIWTTFSDKDLIFGDLNTPFGEARIESRFNWLILSMLQLPEVQKTITAVAEKGADLESKFIDKVKGCDPEATPPPISFQ